MTAIDVWDWGFAFLCPECRTWTGYHDRTGVPIRMTYDVGLGRRPSSVTAHFVCDTCDADLTIKLAQMPWPEKVLC